MRNEVVAASLTEIFYELDKLRSLPVPEPELADARNYLSGIFSMGLATQDGLLSQLATVALNELPDDYLETYRDKVRALTPADLLAAARKYLSTPPTCRSLWLAIARKSKSRHICSATSKFSTPKASTCPDRVWSVRHRSYSALVI